MDASMFSANGEHHLVYRGDNGWIYQVTSSGTILGPYDRNDHLIISANYDPDRYVRHYGFRGQLAAGVTPVADSQFRIVTGLAGTGTVSLESVNFPGYYLRHRNFEVWLDPNDATASFASDASFYRRAGLAAGTAASFESYNYAGRYVRHSAYLLYVQAVSTATDHADATFTVV